jgi:hypothetical protein
MKIRPVWAELFRADGRTDRHDEANSRCGLTQIYKPERGFRTLLKEIFHVAIFDAVIGQPLKIQVFGVLRRVHW